MSLVLIVTDGVWESDAIELDDEQEAALLAIATVTGRSLESLLEEAICAVTRERGRCGPS